MKTWVEVSKKNLLHNARALRSLLAPGVRFMAVVKSNAYGHGMVLVAKTLAHDRTLQKNLWFGVDSADEGIALRKASIKNPILVLGYTPLAHLRDAVRHNLRLTIYNTETVKALGRLNLRKKIVVHIKVETGTTRQGVLESKLLEFARLVKNTPGIELEGLSTHFANIEDTTDPAYAHQQLQRFHRAARLLEKNGISIPIKHAACSAAALLFPETHFNMARMGISLYGFWSSPATHASLNERTKNGSPKTPSLKPVLTWKTIIAQIKTVRRGTPISYGLTERVSRDSRIAVLPVGYYDGYDRELSSAGTVLIHGRRAKILGRVCMNMIMVDVTDIPRAKLEDEVVIIGAQGKEVVGVEELANKIGTIHYEVLARINPLIPKLLV